MSEPTCNTRKGTETDSDPQVDVVWSKLAAISQVRIRGRLAVEQDAAIQQRFKHDNPMVSKLLPQGAEHLFLLCRLRPDRVEMAKTLGPYTEVAW